MVKEPEPRSGTSWLAIASFALASIWYVGWLWTLIFGLLSKDPQGWGWLPYLVWGMWGLPPMFLALLLGAWSIWRDQIRPQRPLNRRIALAGVILCLLAGPVWYGVLVVVPLLRQL